MNMNNGFYSLILVVFLLERDLNATITQGPLNTVAEIGKQVKLDCTADAPIGYWVLSKNGEVNGELTIVGPGCSTLNPPYVDHYLAESLAGGTTCNLIVFNITMEQAGVYKCVQGVAFLASIFTVIESSPVAAVNSTTAVVENEIVIVTCSLHHNGSVAPAPTLRPYFYWTNSGGQNVSSSYDSTTTTTAVSQLTVTAARSNIMPYTCVVYLQLIPPTNPNYANNTPPVSNSATSSVIEVLYSPSVPAIVATTSGFVVCEAKNLTCYSDANPQPNYNWVDLRSGNVTNAQKFIAECGVNYSCNASNIVRDDVYVKSSMFYETSTANHTCKFPRAKNMHISGQTCNEDFCKFLCNPATILCYVDAYPTPSYEWLLPDGSHVEGQTVEASINGIFVCRSYTLIDGWYMVEAYKSVNVSGCSYHPTTTTYSTENNLRPAEIAAIVLGVLLAISITANIFSLVLFYRKGILNQRDSNEPEVRNPTSKLEEPHYQDLFKETLAKSEYEELQH